MDRKGFRLVVNNTDRERSRNEDDIIDQILIDSGVVDKDLLRVMKKIEFHAKKADSATVYQFAEGIIKKSIMRWQSDTYDTNFKKTVESSNEVEKRRQNKAFYKSPEAFISSLSQEEYDAYLEFLKGKGIKQGEASTISLSSEGVIELVDEGQNLTRRAFIKPTLKGNIKVSIQEIMTLRKDSASLNLLSPDMKYLDIKGEILPDITHFLTRMIYNKDGKLVSGDSVKYWNYDDEPTDVVKYDSDSAEWKPVIVKYADILKPGMTSDEMMREYRKARTKGYEVLKREETDFQRKINGFKSLVFGDTYRSERLKELLEYRRKRGKEYLTEFILSDKKGTSGRFPDFVE